MGDLSSSLQAEVSLFLHRESVQNVPLFKRCNADFLVELVGKLTPQVQMPGDYVVRFGEFGNAMYFVTAGTLEVLDSNDRVVVKLGPGAFFGELALIKRVRRTASVRAITYCDLNVLRADDLDVLLRK
jgi:CRP-like cAMP-binding protein